MRHLHRTLRFKLAALNLAVFGMILGALGVTVLTVREDYLRADFDERLIDRAETMVGAIELGEGDARTPRSTDSLARRLNPFRFPGYYFQIRAADGSVLEHSRNLGGVTLPLSDRARTSRESGAPVLERRGDAAAETLLGSGGELRLLTRYCDRSGLPPFFLQVGVSLARVNDSIAELRRLFLLLLPAGLVAVGMASWLMARRSLAPIGRIARQAREYTAAHLDRRIRVLPGNDEVAQMAATINEMLDRLEAAFRAQERFVADASHELQTPISVIMGEARLLSQRAASPEEYGRFASSVLDEMRQLAGLVDSLLILARADAGFPLKAADPVPVNDVVMDAVQRCEPTARQREIRLIPQLALPPGDEACLQIHGDAALLRAMCENLIRNALRHSPPGEAVEVQVDLAEPDVMLRVRDRGPGLPAEALEQIFERFYRVPRGDQPGQGTGLGLAIAKAVVLLHSGSVRAANRPEGGCEFVVRLPLAPRSTAWQISAI